MLLRKVFAIYSIVEWMLRKKLEETGEAVSNHLGKPTRRPTLKWIFQKFRNINQAIIELKGIIHREDINLNEEQIKIIKLLGQGCEKYCIPDTQSKRSMNRTEANIDSRQVDRRNSDSIIIADSYLQI
jgi:hypothetical protein